MPDANTTYVVEQVQAAFDALSAKLGVALPQIWDILVKQAEITASIASTYTTVGMWVFVTCLALFLIGSAFSDTGGAGWFAVLFISGILTLVGAMLVGANYKTSVTCSQNPEYCAMNIIMDSINN